MKASTATIAWVRRYFAAVDRLNLDESLRFFGPESVVRVGNNPPVLGMQMIGESFGQFFALFAGFHHELGDLWEPEKGLLFFEANVTYLHHDGDKVTIPGVTVGRIEPERWVEQRIYADSAAVFAHAVSLITGREQDAARA